MLYFNPLLLEGNKIQFSSFDVITYCLNDLNSSIRERFLIAPDFQYLLFDDLNFSIIFLVIIFV